MKKYIIYLLTRVFHDFNNPKTETTPADEVFVYCDNSEDYERALSQKAENVTIEVLHEFERPVGENKKHDRRETMTDYLMKWYSEWQHPQKEDAVQFLFDDDGGMSSVADHEPVVDGEGLIR